MDFNAASTAIGVGLIWEIDRSQHHQCKCKVCQSIILAEEAGPPAGSVSHKSPALLPIYGLQFVTESMNWWDAQRFCRGNYTDLATVTNMEEMNQIISIAQQNSYSEKAWMGLYNDVNSWRWSMSDSSFYGSDAQSYCRQHHTDLASVRNQSENQRIYNLITTGVRPWIGLFRDTWKWSDGSKSTFTYWNSGEPNNGNENCGQIWFHYNGSWNDAPCSVKRPFVCYTGMATATSPLIVTTPELATHSQDPAARVICTENFMALELARSATIGLHEDHLRLNDPDCTLYSNGTHVLANMSLSTCGTVMEDDGENLIFRNEVVSFDELSDVITRRHDVEIEFYCKYPKQSRLTVEFDAHRPPLTFIQRGFGTFTYQFEFFESDRFSQEKQPDTYPLEFDLGDLMYMQIESTSSVPNTELFAESCNAAPSDDPDEAISYQIIQNGCKMDETVQLFSSHQSKVQLGMKAFKFIGLHDQVFITCLVILCQAGVPGSRCSQGCTNSSTPGHQISKREAPIQTAKHHISQGPLRLRRGVANTVTKSPMNLNLVFVVGGLLAAVAMVCGMLIYKSGGSKVKYERLPASDI
ncbi:ZP domain-containing protein-like [Alosa pseudoharengus]|uniref:ZP domain-containing protein-like n=1 Tax=Alosa pseudoharengus TaxID=34774 RepID=UPI003F8C5545